MFSIHDGASSATSLMKRIVFSLYEPEELTQVQVKLHIDFESILRF